MQSCIQGVNLGRVNISSFGDELGNMTQTALGAKLAEDPPLST
jgi:hypothetical protein